MVERNTWLFRRMQKRFESFLGPVYLSAEFSIAGAAQHSLVFQYSAQVTEQFKRKKVRDGANSF